jgi:hypothetical protein
MPFSSNSFYFIERRTFVQDLKFSNKNNPLSTWMDSKKIFVGYAGMINETRTLFLNPEERTF